MVQSLIRGTPQDKVVKDFAKKMNTSLNQAGRLIATETAYFTTQGEFDSLNNLDVKQYEILATLTVEPQIYVDILTVRYLICLIKK